MRWCWSSSSTMTSPSESTATPTRAETSSSTKSSARSAPRPCARGSLRPASKNRGSRRAVWDRPIRGAKTKRPRRRRSTGAWRSSAPGRRSEEPRMSLVALLGSLLGALLFAAGGYLLAMQRSAGALKEKSTAADANDANDAAQGDPYMGHVLKWRLQERIRELESGRHALEEER